MDADTRYQLVNVRPSAVSFGGRDPWFHSPPELASSLAVSINRYICIYVYCHRASSSAAKRLACEVAKALIEALEAGSPFALRRHH